MASEVSNNQLDQVKSMLSGFDLEKVVQTDNGPAAAQSSKLEKKNISKTKKQKIEQIVCGTFSGYKETLDLFINFYFSGKSTAELVQYYSLYVQSLFSKNTVAVCLGVSPVISQTGTFMQAVNLFQGIYTGIAKANGDGKSVYILAHDQPRDNLHYPNWKLELHAPMQFRYGAPLPICGAVFSLGVKSLDYMRHLAARNRALRAMSIGDLLLLCAPFLLYTMDLNHFVQNLPADASEAQLCINSACLHNIRWHHSFSSISPLAHLALRWGCCLLCLLTGASRASLDLIQEHRSETCEDFATIPCPHPRCTNFANTLAQGQQWKYCGHKICPSVRYDNFHRACYYTNVWTDPLPYDSVTAGHVHKPANVDAVCMVAVSKGSDKSAPDARRALSVVDAFEKKHIIVCEEAKLCRGTTASPIVVRAVHSPSFVRSTWNIPSFTPSHRHPPPF
jgi:hypothetical protein